MRKNIFDRIEVGTATRGHVKVTICYRGKYYTGTISDMTLYDDFVRESHIFCTPRQAAIIMYNQVKRENNLK
jgi:hypothetical protein